MDYQEAEVMEHLRRFAAVGPRIINGMVQSGNPGVRDMGINLRLAFARASFELGFYCGNTRVVEAALRIHPGLMPERETNVLTVELEDGNIASRRIYFEKEEDVVAWQLWRLTSIEIGKYTKPTFTRYGDIMYAFASDGTGVLLANRSELRGTNVKLETRIEDIGELEVTISDKLRMPYEMPHRFRYRVQTDPENIQALTTM